MGKALLGAFSICWFILLVYSFSLHNSAVLLSPVLNPLRLFPRGHQLELYDTLY